MHTVTSIRSESTETDTPLSDGAVSENKVTFKNYPLKQSPPNKSIMSEHDSAKN